MESIYLIILVPILIWNNYILTNVLQHKHVDRKWSNLPIPRHFFLKQNDFSFYKFFRSFFFN